MVTRKGCRLDSWNSSEHRWKELGWRKYGRVIPPPTNTSSATPAPFRTVAHNAKYPTVCRWVSGVVDDAGMRNTVGRHEGCF